MSENETRALDYLKKHVVGMKIMDDDGKVEKHRVFDGKAGQMREEEILVS